MAHFTLVIKPVLGVSIFNFYTAKPGQIVSDGTIDLYTCFGVSLGGAVKISGAEKAFTGHTNVNINSKMLDLKNTISFTNNPKEANIHYIWLSATTLTNLIF